MSRIMRLATAFWERDTLHEQERVRRKASSRSTPATGPSDGQIPPIRWPGTSSSPARKRLTRRTSVKEGGPCTSLRLGKEVCGPRTPSARYDAARKPAVACGQENCDRAHQLATLSVTDLGLMAPLGPTLLAAGDAGSRTHCRIRSPAGWWPLRQTALRGRLYRRTRIH